MRQFARLYQDSNIYVAVPLRQIERGCCGTTKNPVFIRVLAFRKHLK